MMKEHVVGALEARGVTVSEIAEIVFTLQKPYVPSLDLACASRASKRS